MGNVNGSDWARKRPPDQEGATFSALARAPVLRFHLLHRIQSQLGRIQGHGTGAIRRAAIQGLDPRKNRGPETRRDVRLDQSYFNYCTGLTMTNGRFSNLFGRPVRKPETEPLTQFHM